MALRATSKSHGSEDHFLSSAEKEIKAICAKRLFLDELLKRSD